MNKASNIIPTFIIIIVILAIGAAIYVFITQKYGVSINNTAGTGVEANGKSTIQLPEPRTNSNTSIEQALKQRRSVREYKDDPLTLSELSQLLWAAQGQTNPKGYRTAPSAGALYPLEMYVAAGNVSDLPVGVYHYNSKEHTLTKRVDGDKRAELYETALSQSAVKDAAAVIILTAEYARTTVKYGNRGIRYVHLETGHAAQNIYLQAVALNLGTVTIGAFDDNKVKNIIAASDKEVPLYLMPVGKK